MCLPWKKLSPKLNPTAAALIMKGEGREGGIAYPLPSLGLIWYRQASKIHFLNTFFSVPFCFVVDNCDWFCADDVRNGKSPLRKKVEATATCGYILGLLGDDWQKCQMYNFHIKVWRSPFANQTVYHEVIPVSYEVISSVSADESETWSTKHSITTRDDNGEVDVPEAEVDLRGCEVDDDEDNGQSAT